mgnify:CR=1 FL=1|jgi:hypothetical protein
MPSIEASHHPLIFKIENHEALPKAKNDDENKIAIRQI